MVTGNIATGAGKKAHIRGQPLYIYSIFTNNHAKMLKTCLNILVLYKLDVKEHAIRLL